MKSSNLKFDIFGRKTLEVLRADGQWLAFYRGTDGLRRKAEDVRIPGDLCEADLADYLADIFHEWATPERSVVKRLQ